MDLNLLEWLAKYWQILIGIGGFIGYGAWIRFQIKELMDYRDKNEMECEKMDSRVKLLERTSVESIHNIEINLTELKTMLREHLNREDRK